MRFTLHQNTISFLHIAIEKFKDFFYGNDSVPLSTSERDEKIKIAIVFYALFSKNAILFLN